MKAETEGRKDGRKMMKERRKEGGERRKVKKVKKEGDEGWRRKELGEEGSKVEKERR